MNKQPLSPSVTPGHGARVSTLTVGRHLPTALLLGLAIGLCASLLPSARAADHTPAADHTVPVLSAKATHVTKAAPAEVPAASAAESPALAIDIKKALRDQMLGRKRLTLVISDKPERAHAAPAHAQAAIPVESAAPLKPAVAHAAHPAVASHAPALNPHASRDYIKAKAAALTGHSGETALDLHGNVNHGEAHWTYSGATGPEAWGQLKPEFSACATGKRQSPINIEESYTLQGPAEPLQFNYAPSNGTVINNGHTIQVEVQGNNMLTVRGVNYNLVQFHFHTPSEEQINYRHYAMVAHLVHQSAEGQLAVVSVLLDPGEPNTLINKVWTYMPLDISDKVRMPAGLLELGELLPKDQRYYQFIGSLTTPPCTEGVLWLVFKQPVQLSKEQLRLFQQLYPHNARPVQAVNNRPVRNAQ